MAFGRKETLTITKKNDPNARLLFPYPSFGYTVELRKALNIQRFAQKVSAFDRGLVHDRRLCAFKLLTERVQELEEIFRPTADNDRYIMCLPDNCGFYPAGPDKGDSGDFEFSLAEEVKWGSMLTTPYGMFEVAFNILIHNAPNTNVPASPKEFGGLFDFGGAKGIRSPKIAPTQEFGRAQAITLGGENFSIMTPTAEYLSDITITTNTRKMAEVANVLQNERGEGISIKGHNLYFWWGGLFDTRGREQQVRLLSDNYIFTHISPELWGVTVPLWYEGTLVDGELLR